MEFCKKLIIIMICQALFFGASGTGQRVWAADTEYHLSLPKDLVGKNRGSEYISGEMPGAALMKVNLLGAVNKPGIHYVPVNTDLLTLISYAGGTVEAADMSDITIRRQTKADDDIIPINLESQIKRKDAKPLMLQSNDVIVIPANRPTVSQNTLATIGLISSIASIILVGFVVYNNVK